MLRAAQTTEPVLLVEDTPSLSTVYQNVLRRAGVEVVPAHNAAEARKAFAERAFAVVLMDLMLPDGNGLDVLADMHATAPETRVVVITSDGSVNRAVEAMRRGAFDFLVKPFDERRLLSAVDNARRVSMATPAPLRSVPSAGSKQTRFVGSSDVMHTIYDKISKIAQSTATVFITGESGTGKELVAQEIHARSTRAGGPFVPINCGAIPRELLESEVFGHLKGSFTGAISDKMGAATSADTGTLFLDEVCEMDLSLQTKLLRFLQTSMVQPVGATEAHKIDVRIVCATNRDPHEEVRAGRFREDLFYRLHVVPISLPALRERGEDVIEIAEVLLSRFNEEEGKSFERIGADVAEALRQYHWPGNVRQLENALRNVVVLHDAHAVTLAMLPPFLTGNGEQWQPKQAFTPPSADAGGGAMTIENALQSLVGMPIAMVERGLIEATIEACEGSVPKAARILDVSPSTLYRKREAWTGR